MDLAVGSRVKSGGSGPALTIESLDDDGVHAVCSWWTKAKTLKRDRFPVATLVKIQRMAIGVASGRNPIFRR